MPRKQRMFNPDSVFFITSKTIQSRLLMRPSPYINDLIGGVLAKATHEFADKVDLYAYAFVSNHFHMLVRAEPKALPRFIGWIKSNIALKVGREVEWEDTFWKQRYDAIQVVDDDALVERLRYILAHGVKEGLVEKAQNWPGVHCAPQLAWGINKVYHWYDWTLLGQAKRSGKQIAPKKFKIPYTIKIKSLPCWVDVSDKERQGFVQKLLEEIEQEAKIERQGRPVLGARLIVSQNPLDKPKTIKLSKKPICHATTKSARESYKKAELIFLQNYRIASEAYRNGKLTVEFPEYAFRPSLAPLYTHSPPERVASKD